MKKTLKLSIAGLSTLGLMSVGVGMGVASAQTTTTTTTTLAPPVQGTTPLPVAFNVDTVVATGGTGALQAPVGCAQTNEFLIGQTVVFRMSGQDVLTGGQPLTPKNVSSATITVPGLSTPLTMNYGNHGSVAFWSVGWNTAGYPTTGIVNFQIVVKTIQTPAVTKRVVVRIRERNGKVVTRVRTKVITPAIPGVTATYSQAGYAPPSELTLNAVPAS
jgi:hypothetical protein